MEKCNTWITFCRKFTTVLRQKKKQEAEIKGKEIIEKNMKMNRFKELAKVFNLDLEEEFHVKPTDKDLVYGEFYKFTEDGLKIRIDDNWVDWVDLCDSVLFQLLKGDYEVVYLPFKPKDGEAYWFLSYAEPISQLWGEDNEDLTYWKCGNCFRTKEEAELKGKKLMEQIRKEFRDE